jgi:hypothetical protein
MEGSVGGGVGAGVMNGPSTLAGGCGRTFWVSASMSSVRKRLMSLDFRLSGARFEEEGWLNSVRGLEQVTSSAEGSYPWLINRTYLAGTTSS